MSDDYLTSKQVAERVNVAHETLCRWRQTKKGPAFIRRCGRIYYSLTEIENWYRNGDNTSTLVNEQQ
jgi:hypothetical protein